MLRSSQVVLSLVILGALFHSPARAAEPYVYPPHVEQAFVNVTTGHSQNVAAATGVAVPKAEEWLRGRLEEAAKRQVELNIKTATHMARTATPGVRAKAAKYLSQFERRSSGQVNMDDWMTPTLEAGVDREVSRRATAFRRLVDEEIVKLSTKPGVGQSIAQDVQNLAKELGAAKTLTQTRAVLARGAAYAMLLFSLGHALLTGINQEIEAATIDRRKPKETLAVLRGAWHFLGGDAALAAGGRAWEKEMEQLDKDIRAGKDPSEWWTRLRALGRGLADVATSDANPIALASKLIIDEYLKRGDDEFVKLVRAALEESAGPPGDLEKLLRPRAGALVKAVERDLAGVGQLLKEVDAQTQEAEQAMRPVREAVKQLEDIGKQLDALRGDLAAATRDTKRTKEGRAQASQLASDLAKALDAVRDALRAVEAAADETCRIVHPALDSRDPAQVQKAAKAANEALDKARQAFARLERAATEANNLWSNLARFQASSQVILKTTDLEAIVKSVPGLVEKVRMASEKPRRSINRALELAGQIDVSLYFLRTRVELLSQVLRDRPSQYRIELLGIEEQLAAKQQRLVALDKEAAGVRPGKADPADMLGIDPGLLPQLLRIAKLTETLRKELAAVQLLDPDLVEDLGRRASTVMADRDAGWRALERAIRCAGKLKPVASGVMVLKEVRYTIEKVTGSDSGGNPRDRAVEKTGVLKTASGTLDIRYDEQWKDGFATMKGKVTFLCPATIQLQSAGSKPKDQVAVQLSAEAQWSNKGLGWGRPTGITIGDKKKALKDKKDSKMEFGNDSGSVSVSWSESIPWSPTLRVPSVDVHGKQTRTVILQPIYEPR